MEASRNLPSKNVVVLQMILEALDSLKQPEGANKSSISKYGEMPAGHADLLSHHLTRMRDSGDLFFLKNNYLRPGPDGPPVKRPRTPSRRGAWPCRKDPSSPAVAPAPKKAKEAAAAPPKLGR